MYLDLPTLRSAARAAVHPRRSAPRVAGWTAAFASAFVVCRTAVGVAQRLDRVLYPELTRTEVREPVFILAMPRSGTTRLHGLLGLDEERFTSFKLYQTLFPSVCAYRIAGALGSADDRLLAGRARKLVERASRSTFPRFQAIHPIGLDRPEEDEALFLYMLASTTLRMLFPLPGELPERWLDELPAERRALAMRFYHACVQRHVYADGGERTMLVKNVWTAPRAASLLQAFPDARIVHLVRHPYRAIPSAVSMFSMPWRTLFPGRPTDGPEFQAFARLMMRFQRRYAELAEALPPERVVTVHYDELVRSPGAAVEQIYRHFGWAVPASLASRLVDEERAQRAYSSVHRYALSDFGLTEEEVHREMTDLFERYGFAS